MDEPRVVSLRYSLQVSDTLEFQNPPPIERETAALKLRLEAGVATAWLKEHHWSPDSARVVVEKYLRRWELSAALQYGGSLMCRSSTKALGARASATPGRSATGYQAFGSDGFAIGHVGHGTYNANILPRSA